MKLYMAHCICGMVIDDNWRCCPMCGEEVERDNVTDTNVGKMTEEEAIAWFEDEVEGLRDDSKYKALLIMAIEALQFQASVVRCKDCRHYDTEEGWESGYCFVCHHHMNDVDIDWLSNEFCSKGERRDEE